MAKTMNRLLQRTSGALALVSGRSLNDIDLIFAPAEFPAVGGHGAEMRIMVDNEAVASHAPPMDKELKKRLAAIAWRYCIAAERQPLESVAQPLAVVE